MSDMEWVGVQDISHDLLLALHPPYHLVLWNTENGSRLWRKTYADLFQSFSFDPFDPARVAFLGQDFVVFVDDFSLTKAPNGTGKKFFISSPSTQVNACMMNSVNKILLLMLIYNLICFYMICTHCKYYYYYYYY